MLLALPSVIAPLPEGRNSSALRWTGSTRWQGLMKQSEVAAFWQRRGRIGRGSLALLALVCAAVVGIGLVVGVGQLSGTTKSVRPATATAIQTSLPPSPSPAPVLKALDPAAPEPTAAGLSAALAAAAANPALGTLTGRILDSQTGAVLFDKSAGQALQPGSTMKLYTAIAAAQSIKPGTRITTKVVAGIAPGQIVLIGGGDPTLSTTDTSPYYPGSATVAQLAAAIKPALSGPVTSIVVDDSAFAGAPEATGWGAGDAPSTYAASIYPVMVDGGRAGPGEDAMRSANPDLAAAKALAKALGFPAAKTERGAASPAAAVLGSVQSAPIEDLIEQALTQSDNVLAECIGRQIAIANGMEPSFTGTVNATNKVLAELGVDTTGRTAFDASGLSQQDLASAASIASVLAVANDGKFPLTDTVNSALAIAGYNGTLATRFQAGPAAAAVGDVRAKTGTLTAVSALAGTVVTKDGRLLIFALLSNGGTNTTAARAALDEIAAVLAGCGCR